MIEKKPTQQLLGRLVKSIGGPARARVVGLFAAVLALNYADVGAIGAMAPKLEQAFHIGHTDLGLIATVTAAVGAVSTLLFGWLVDRTLRVRLLAAAVFFWAVSMTLTAFSVSYEFLLLTRVALGIGVAVAMPAIASLVGDFFPSHDRGQIYGYILSGELIGTGFGFIVAGELALVSWRLGFLALALPAMILAWGVKRLPEPERGGGSRLLRGQQKIVVSQDAGLKPEPEEESGQSAVSRLIETKVREKGVKPRSHLVLSEDPKDKSLWWAVGYVLRIPTNLILVGASAMGYYFFAGIRVFGLVYFTDKFDLSHSVGLWLLILMAGGAIVGVLFGGRLGDRFLARGHLPGRVLVASVSYISTTVLFLVGLLSASLPVSFLCFFAAAAALGCVNPPLDAARLDIMHPHLWGRAEAIRTMLRWIAEASAPLVFGYISEEVFGGGGTGLQKAFLLMLVPLFISGLLGFVALRTYPRDVATAVEFARRTRKG
jgi:MFS family permease